ncbi:MAG TPA: SIMPL domain-containing protein [Magnetospirillaceae bacterium]
MRFAVPILALALVILPQLPAWAVDPAGNAATETGTVVHLIERAERQMPRDRLNAVLRADDEGLDPAKVQDDINRRMQAALAQAKTVTTVKVESGSYSVYRQQSAAQTGTVPEKWVASQTIALTSTDFTPALALIGTLQGQGLTIESLVFDVAPETLRSVQDEMTTEALAALRTRAGHVADGMGMRIARYKTLDVGNVTTQEIRPLPIRMMTAKASADAAPATSAGESTAFLTVDAQVILESK